MKILLFILLSAMATSVARADLIDDLGELEEQVNKPATPGKPAAKPPSDPSVEKEVNTSPFGDQSPPSQAPKKTPAGKPLKPGTKSTKGASGGNRTAKLPVYFSSSDKATYSKDGGVIDLNKTVVIEQGPIMFNADKAKVFLNPNGESGGNQVEKVLATGGVRMHRQADETAEQISATGDELFFLNEQQTVTLIGKAKIIKGGNVIRGKKITYHLDSGKIVVDQAEGTVSPEESK